MQSSFMASFDDLSPRLRYPTEDLSNSTYNEHNEYDECDQYNQCNEDNEQSKARFTLFQRKNKEKTKTINDANAHNPNAYDFDEDTKQMKNPYILIIGIVNYDPPTQSLRGVKKDIMTMKRLWKIKYNFKNVFCITDDINSKKINEQTLNSWLNHHRNKIYNLDETKEDEIDGLIVLYSGHGGNHGNTGSDYIICSDNEKYEINEIQKKFSSLQCENLCGKPKIYYFDCCRATEEHKEYNYNEYSKGNSTRPKARRVNEDSDIFMHFACCNNKESKITDNRGSYMINAINNCYTMNLQLQNGKIANLNKISQKINKEINISKNGQQTPEIINRLTYDVCIIPVTRAKNAPISVNQSHQPFYNAGLDIKHNHSNQKTLFANQNPLFYNQRNFADNVKTRTRPREYSKSSTNFYNNNGNKKQFQHNSASLLRKKSKNKNKNKIKVNGDFIIMQPQQLENSKYSKHQHAKSSFAFHNIAANNVQKRNQCQDKINHFIKKNEMNEDTEPFIPPSPEQVFNLKCNNKQFTSPLIPLSPKNINISKVKPNKMNQPFAFVPPSPHQVFLFTPNEHAIYTINGYEHDVRVISVDNSYSQIVVMFNSFNNNSQQTLTVHPRQLKKKIQPQMQRKMNNDIPQRYTNRNNTYNSHYQAIQQMNMPPNVNQYTNMKAQTTSPRNFMQNNRNGMW